MSVPRSAQYVELLFALRSTPMDDVSHEVSVDPVDNARIDISDLKLGGHPGVSGTAIDPDHVRHPPGPFRFGDDYGHARFDVQEDRVWLGCCNGTRMINRHSFFDSTAVLV